MFRTALFAALPLFASTELVVPVRPPGAINSIVIGNGGNWFATLSPSAPGVAGVMQIWSLPGVLHLRTFEATLTRAIAAHPSKPVIARGNGYALDLLDASNGTVLPLSTRLPEQANVLAWSPDGTYLVGGWRRLMRIDAATGRSAFIPNLPDAMEVHSLQFIKKGAGLLVALNDRVILYSTGDWQIMAQFEGHSRNIRMAVDPSEATLATIAADMQLRFYSLRDYKTAADPFTVSIPKTSDAALFNTSPEVQSLVFSADGKSLGMFVSLDGFRVYDTAARTLSAASHDIFPTDLLTADYSRKTILASDASGNFLVDDGSLRNIRKSAPAGKGSQVIDAVLTKSGVLGVFQPREKLTGNRQVTGAWSFGSAMENVISGFDHPIGVIERRAGVTGPFLVLCSETGLTVRNTVSGDEETFANVTWAERVSADGRWAAGWDPKAGRLRLFDIPAKTERGIPLDEKDPVFILSPAGNAVAVYSGDAKSSRVRLWALPSMRELHDFNPVIDARRDGSLIILATMVMGAAFSSDGAKLAVIHGDYRTRVVDIASAKVDTFDTPMTSLGAMAFAPDGNHLAVGQRNNTITVFSLDSSAPPRTISGLPAPPDFLKYPDDGTLLLAGTEANTLVVFDEASGAKRGSLYVESPEGPWMAYTDSGFFDGSEQTWNDLLWRFDSDTFRFASAGRYFGDFFNPGLFGRILGGDVPKPSASLETIDRKTAELKLRLLSSPSGTPDIEIASESSSASARDVRLFRNGALVHSWDGPMQAPLRAPVHLQSGPNEFTAYAFNDAKVRSEPAGLIVTGPLSGRKPGVLHVLAVGIDKYPAGLELRYAVSDARAFAESLRNERARVAEFASALTRPGVQDDRAARLVASSGVAEVTLLSDSEATKQRILSEIRAIATRAAPEDSFIFFFSGHGMADGGGYYLFPRDVSFTRSDPAALAATRRTAISDRDLADALADLDVSASALIIDACESGQATQSADDWRRGPIDARGLAQLAYEKDMFLLAAAQSNQAAVETDKLQHGVLTYALVEEALVRGRAIPEFDAGLELGDWLSWAARRVPFVDAETIAGTRGVLLPDRPIAGQHGAVSQRPTLLARRRPGAASLVIAVPKADPLADPLLAKPPF